MHFKHLLFLLSLPLAAHGSELYWEQLLEKAKADPAYESFISASSTGGLLSKVEAARKAPQVDGVLSRVDGNSSLSETSDAIQAGITVSYPLFDNGAQESRDRIAELKGQLKVLEATQELERSLVSYSRAHSVRRAVAEKMILLNRSTAEVVALKDQISKAAELGEASFLDVSKIDEKLLELESELVELRLEEATASAVWPDAVDLDTDLNIERAFLKQEDSAQVAALRKELELLDEQALLTSTESGLKVDLSGSYLHRSYSRGPDSNNFVWSVSAKYPLFDGGLVESRVALERSEALNREIELRSLLSSIETEIQQKHDYLKSKQDIRRRKLRICEQREALRSKQEQRFDLGRGSVEDLLDITVSINSCYSEAIELEADLRKVQADLAMLDGTLLKVLSEKL